MGQGQHEHWVTLGHLEKHGADLLAWCPGCSRHVSIPLELAIARYSRGRRVPSIRARCSVCGHIAAVAPDYRPPSERARERERDRLRYDAAGPRRPAW